MFEGGDSHGLGAFSSSGEMEWLLPPGWLSTKQYYYCILDLIIKTGRNFSLGHFDLVQGSTSSKMAKKLSIRSEVFSSFTVHFKDVKRPKAAALRSETLQKVVGFREEPL
ncbi:unnamed protein product [Strongylus vulgaris]|uniref:Uncharacterized protein n=1 Tax=Strongylus vulgaris TaxID=40348 RepID=A0A3P7I655_STRVU|nr:unnamed protein product [Strongylus vulgaris]